MLNRNFYHGINLLLALVILFMIAELLTPNSISGRFDFTLPAAESQPVGSSKNPLKIVLQAHLFGDKPGLQIKLPALQAPETTLNLNLKGVMMAQSANDSYAIISSPNASDRSYNLNDILPGNGRITHIFTDRIILDNGGRQESLRLSLPIGSQPAPASNRSNKSNQGRRATISGFRDQFVKNPSILGDILSAEPVTLKNGHSGWQVSPGNNATLFNQLGLKPGDLVMAINGVSAKNSLSRIALLNELATADQLNLKVLRKEKVLSFYFTMTN